MAVGLIEATDEMYNVVEAAWAKACLDALEMIEPGELIFDVISVDMQSQADAKTTVWARVAKQTTAGDRRAIGGRLWRNAGLLQVQVLVPMKPYGRAAGTIAETLAGIVLGVIRGHANGAVEFTTAFASPVGFEGTAYRFDVTSEFSFYTASEEA